jgi:hypothetical protein
MPLAGGGKGAQGGREVIATDTMVMDAHPGRAGQVIELASGGRVVGSAEDKQAGQVGPG